MLSTTFLLLAAASCVAPNAHALLEDRIANGRAIVVGTGTLQGTLQGHRRSLRVSCVELEDDGAVVEATEEEPEEVKEEVEDIGEVIMVDTPPKSPSGGCRPPSSLPGMEAVLKASKVQAPSSGDNVKELDGFCNNYFFAEGEYMRFMTDDERSELRIPMDTDEKKGFVVRSATASLKATLRLPNKNLAEEDHYTWMQVHGDDTSWIRLAHYGEKNGAMNNIWLFIKEGSSSSNDLTSISMGPVPSGDFDAGIVLPGDDTVTIYAGDFSQTFDIDWSDDLNYFKAGSYVQDGNPSTFPVDYKKLLYSLQD